MKTRTVEDRIVGTRGGTARDSHVTNNVFYKCGKGIDFSHKHNTADGNLYSRATLAGEEEDEYNAEGRGLNWISGPAPALRLVLPAWQKYFGLDKNGAYADIKVDIDLDALKFSNAFSKPTVLANSLIRHAAMGACISRNCIWLISVGCRFGVLSMADILDGQAEYLVIQP